MDCIEWTGYKHPTGYGRRYNPRTQKIDVAHRVAWEEANGKAVPVEMVVMHACANRSCVNPDHLLLGTQSENRHEMVTRNANPKQKITQEEAELLLWCRRQGPRRGNYGWNKQVAEVFAVSVDSIGRICRRESFKEAG